MIERHSADVTSIEEMVSQKSAFNVWVSAYLLQERDGCVPGGPASWDMQARRMGDQFPPGGYRGYTQVVAAHISIFYAP